MKKVFMSVQLSKDLAQQARVAAAVKGVSRSELVRRAITNYLRRLDTPPDGDYSQQAQRGEQPCEN